MNENRRSKVVDSICEETGDKPEELEANGTCMNRKKFI